MNSRITLIIVAFSVMTFSMIPFQQQIQQNAFAQDDESDTDTEQRLRQSNLGSGESTNFNCAENMITSASDGTDCIPSGPAPPTPPTGAFTISGEGSGTYTCGIGAPTGGSIVISAQGVGDGSATGTVSVVIFAAGGEGAPSTGTTDGNTFSLSGVRGIVGCGRPVQAEFTVSGDCGNDVMISYQDVFLSGTFTGNVECTLA